MRFPIVVQERGFGKTFPNLSFALEESLEDIGVLDLEKGEEKQEYFDLPINEGPILRSFSEYFDLTGDFHVGCTLDERPPSFNFKIIKGNRNTREGEFCLFYYRTLKLNVFLRNNSFRNTKRHRDLETLARAYNQQGNYEEVVGVAWGGRMGENSNLGFNDKLGLEFDDTFLSSCFGIDYLNKEKIFESPLYGKFSPLHQFTKDTKLEEIWKKYNEREEILKEKYPIKTYIHSLSELNYNISDVLYGILQVAYKIFPAKKGLEQKERMIEVDFHYKIFQS